MPFILESVKQQIKNGIRGQVDSSTSTSSQDEKSARSGSKPAFSGESPVYVVTDHDEKSVQSDSNPVFTGNKVYVALSPYPGQHELALKVWDRLFGEESESKLRAQYFISRTSTESDHRGLEFSISFNTNSVSYQKDILLRFWKGLIDAGVIGVGYIIPFNNSAWPTTKGVITPFSYSKSDQLEFAEEHAISYDDLLDYKIGHAKLAQLRQTQVAYRKELLVTEQKELLLEFNEILESKCIENVTLNKAVDNLSKLANEVLANSEIKDQYKEDIGTIKSYCCYPYLPFCVTKLEGAFINLDKSTLSNSLEAVKCHMRDLQTVHFNDLKEFCRPGVDDQSIKNHIAADPITMQNLHFQLKDNEAKREKLEEFNQQPFPEDLAQDYINDISQTIEDKALARNKDFKWKTGTVGGRNIHIVHLSGNTVIVKVAKGIADTYDYINEAGKRVARGELTWYAVAKEVATRSKARYDKGSGGWLHRRDNSTSSFYLVTQDNFFKHRMTTTLGVSMADASAEHEEQRIPSQTTSLYLG